MGLDMWLTARRRVFSSEAEYGGAVESLGIRGHLETHEPALTVEFVVGDWRKANAVHGWFVREVQSGRDDTGVYNVARSELEQLRALCKKVLASTTPAPAEEGGELPAHEGCHGDDGREDEELDRRLAEELLPTSAGFFFGSRDYDWEYLECLRDTVAVVDRALALPDEWWFEYTSSW